MQDTSTASPAFAFDNLGVRDLVGAYVPWQPAPAPAPRWLWFNRALADAMGLDSGALAGDAGLAVFSGNVVPEGAQPIAQAYAGHQFGGFSPQLGDGRALLLGEVIDRAGRRCDIGFKGSGRTPFARGGDGKAAVGPVLREVLIGEAMHALGIPTTRALAAVATGETIYRERPLPGAVLTRVAASHLRVGTLQYGAARRDIALLRRTAEHAIARHDPHLAGREDRFLALLEAVCERQALLVARWLGVGFIHGVMNTDNMTLSGETIDYGPCAFMEAFDPQTVFSSIDTQGRYAFAHQPGMAHWNLARLAEALLPLIDPQPDRAVQLVTAVLDRFDALFSAQWLAVHRAKLGLDDRADADDADRALVNDYLQGLHRHGVDFTLGWRRLGDLLRGQPAALRALWGDGGAELDAWLPRWHSRLADQGLPDAQVAQRLDAANPLCIPRNHLVENALADASEHGDLRAFETLLAVVTRPFAERPEGDRMTLPGTPEQTRHYRTFCGT
ncbi:MAG: protein adenylyltransferase SelO [Hydrogenophaga sp.]